MNTTGPAISNAIAKTVTRTAAPETAAVAAGCCPMKEGPVAGRVETAPAGTPEYRAHLGPLALPALVRGGRGGCRTGPALDQLAHPLPGWLVIPAQPGAPYFPARLGTPGAELSDRS